MDSIKLMSKHVIPYFMWRAVCTRYWGVLTIPVFRIILFPPNPAQRQAIDNRG